jgi:hypothetical protein
MGMNCFYCGEADGNTKDHAIPKSRHPGFQLGPNIVPACLPCNNDKGSLTVDEYRAVIAFRNGVSMEQLRFPGEGGPNLPKPAPLVKQPKRWQIHKGKWKLK